MKTAMRIMMAVLLLVGSLHGQTVLRSVMVNTNGVVQNPTNFIATNRIVSVTSGGQVNNPSNFWTANASSILSLLPQSESLAAVFSSPLASLTTYASNAIAQATNGVGIMYIDGATNSGASAIRLMQEVNNRESGGSGTLFAEHNHTISIVGQMILRANGLMRVVLGSSAATNDLAAYPSSAAVGFELDEINTSTNRVRLIAHNGTVATNGPWVDFGDIFQQYTFVVFQNRTNGTVQLSIGTNLTAPVLQTNATISGGPTVNAPFDADSLDIRISKSSTNNGATTFKVQRAMVEISR